QPTSPGPAEHPGGPPAGASRDAGPGPELCPRLTRRAIESFGSEDVLRFLGRPVTAAGRVPPRYQGEVTSDRKRRPEGVRIKHRAGRNAGKRSDKPGSVLRGETTLNEVKGLKS